MNAARMSAGLGMMGADQGTIDQVRRLIIMGDARSEQQTKQLGTLLAPYKEQMEEMRQSATMDNPLADGAIFGFFENWDPELFVLVETRVKQPGRWMIGVIRFSNKQLALQLADKSIWQYDPAGSEPPLGGPGLLYFSRSLETRPHLLQTQVGPEAKP